MLAEAWRAGSRQASLARFLALCSVESMSEQHAKSRRRPLRQSQPRRHRRRDSRRGSHPQTRCHHHLQPHPRPQDRRRCQSQARHRTTLTQSLRLACQERLRGTTGADGAHRRRSMDATESTGQNSSLVVAQRVSEPAQDASRWVGASLASSSKPSAAIAAVTLRRSWSDQLQLHCSRHG